MDMKECCTFSLGSYAKQAGDEYHLIQDISFAHAMHLSLSDHVHHFKAPARVRHAVSNEKEACAGYLAYPFHNQEVNSHTGNFHTTYLMAR
jgi:hypothetical protein